MVRSVVSDAVCGGGNVACRKYPFIQLKNKYVGWRPKCDQGFKCVLG